VYQCYSAGRAARIYLQSVFPFEIVQTQGRVLMVFEYDHPRAARIFTDGPWGIATILPPSWMG